MNLRSLTRALIVSIVLAATLPSAALAEPTDAQRQAMAMKIDELRDRLALTPEQESKLAPLLQERNAKLQDLWARRDPDASRREKRALMNDAKAIQEDFTRKITPILTKEQLQQWDAFRKEARAEAMDRYRSRQN